MGSREIREGDVVRVRESESGGAVSPFDAGMVRSVSHGIVTADMVHRTPNGRTECEISMAARCFELWTEGDPGLVRTALCRAGMHPDVREFLVPGEGDMAMHAYRVDRCVACGREVG